MAGILLLGRVISNKVSMDELNTLIYKKMNNWALSDTLASEVVVKVVNESNGGIKLISDWIQFDDEWVRRSAVVALIKARANVENWDKLAQKTVDGLKNDKNEYVNKAIVWLRKEMKKG